jgi:hypothetical protein
VLCEPELTLVQIGYNASEEFTNHWWTLDFNKAASSIHINTTEGGIEVVSSTSCCKSKPTTGSNYRQFLKSQSTESNSESYSRDVGQSVKERFIYSDQLFTACSGRTGHKAARHGNRLLGKLKRLKRQEEHPSNESRKNKKIKASHTGKVKTT